MNKKILLSLFVVLLVAISLGSVSAEDATDVVAADDVDDVVAIDETPEVLSTNYTPASDSVEDVQIAVDSAVNPGDTVDLSGYAEYDFTNKTVTISHDGVIIDGKGTTTIKGYGDGNGIFAIKAKQVTITGITFINTNPKNNFTYGGTVAGDAISASAADGGLVSGCEFNNFSSGVKVMSTTGFTIEDSTFNGGYTTVLKNDPSVNKEQGTKALNIYKQSQEISVINNTFVGPMLDAVSIAQGSGSNLVLNNTFIGNAYSIYFGGASTEGTVIKGNRFIKCGAFNDTIADFNMSSLPIISTEKSSNDIIIEDNIFEVINGSILIAAESGNEAHGDPTEISNFTIIDNKVIKANNEVNASSVMLLHILGRGDQLNVTTPITVVNNTIEDGMKMVGIYFGQNKFNQEEYLTTTEDIILSGVISKDNGTDNGTANGTDNSTSGNGTAPVNPGNSSNAAPAAPAAPATTSTPAKKTVKITAKKKTFKAKSKKKKYTVTLKVNGKALKKVKVTLKIKGKTYKATTNSKGKATFNLKKLTKKGKYTAVIKFAGSSAYKAATKKVKITIK